MYSRLWIEPWLGHCLRLWQKSWRTVCGVVCEPRRKMAGLVFLQSFPTFKVEFCYALITVLICFSIDCIRSIECSITHVPLTNIYSSVLYRYLTVYTTNHPSQLKFIVFLRRHHSFYQTWASAFAWMWSIREWCEKKSHVYNIVVLRPSHIFTSEKFNTIPHLSSRGRCIGLYRRNTPGIQSDEKESYQDHW